MYKDIYVPGLAPKSLADIRSETAESSPFSGMSERVAHTDTTSSASDTVS